MAAMETISLEAQRLFTWITNEQAVQISLAMGLLLGFVVGWALRARLGGVTIVQEGKDEEVTTYTMAGSGEYKMILVVRQDLGMGKGKVAAQCCHAAVGLCRQLLKNNPKVLRMWENAAQPKVVVKAPDEDALVSLSKKARSLGLETCLIRDAGRTQIAPGSKTVLGVGPGPLKLVDQVTGHLKLY